ncbi:hypothetical protein QBC46DRAFT_300566 [Diplogelasinospora grovesii]|uniref:Uncharacterized protein n=1 Tax=Diplogelasinospora grovesii TaxID=303347 RepID=A0AAN6MUY0_9PEZI|nr:hypothetical protein QBC46DRAFT_300566 [Diplogelasinospora grovesii]
MKLEDFEDTCNKSVPVYILMNEQWLLVNTVLYNYIYRRWFRPYRSEIERSRFICKFIAPIDLPDRSTPPSTSVIDTLTSLNHTICTHVQDLHQAYSERAVEYANDQNSKWAPYEHFIWSHEFHVLQPLFRALLIVVCCDDYNNEDSKTVGRLPVYLVRTGIEDGLSPPITFESIADKIESRLGDSERVVKTTLETAIDFTMGLEAREAAVFGLQPDPTVLSQALADGVGNELLRMPSSQFVSDEKALEWGWSGEGEAYESKIMPHYEQREFRFDALRIARQKSQNPPNTANDGAELAK